MTDLIDENDPTFGIDHPTTKPDSPETTKDSRTFDSPVEIEFPDGTTEKEDAEYDILVAADPREFFPQQFEETEITRLEYDNVGDLEEFSVHGAIEDGFQRFVADGGSVDALVEKVYTRTVGERTSLCLVIRSPASEGPARSQFALAIDEQLQALCDR